MIAPGPTTSDNDASHLWEEYKLVKIVTLHVYTLTTMPKGMEEMYMTIEHDGFDF